MARTEDEILAERKKNNISTICTDIVLIIICTACLFFFRDRVVDIIGGEENFKMCFAMAAGLLGTVIALIHLCSKVEESTRLDDDEKREIEIERRLDTIEWRLEHGCGPEEKSISELERRIKELERHRHE